MFLLVKLFKAIWISVSLFCFVASSLGDGVIRKKLSARMANFSFLSEARLLAKRQKQHVDNA